MFDKVVEIVSAFGYLGVFALMTYFVWLNK